MTGLCEQIDSITFERTSLCSNLPLQPAFASPALSPSRRCFCASPAHQDLPCGRTLLRILLAPRSCMLVRCNHVHHHFAFAFASLMIYPASPSAQSSQQLLPVASLTLTLTLMKTLPSSNLLYFECDSETINNNNIIRREFSYKSLENIILYVPRRRWREQRQKKQRQRQLVQRPRKACRSVQEERSLSRHPAAARYPSTNRFVQASHRGQDQSAMQSPLHCDADSDGTSGRIRGFESSAFH